MSDLGRLRVLCGRLGLDQTTFSHLPPDEEREALIGFAEGLAHGLDSRGMTLDQYERTIRPWPEDSTRVVRLSPRRRGR